MAKDLYIPVSIRGGRLEAKAQLGQTVIVKEGPEKYTPAPITPSESQQTIPTKDKQLTADVVVEPIPSEYIIPTGTEVINVTENGTVSRDVSAKETVTVNTNVPIPPGYIIPTGNLRITENGQYDITEKESVNVDVPIPTGTKQISISENGMTTEDIAGYANAEISVDVPIPPGYIIPTGNMNITENGQYDITDKASVNVDVPAPVPTGTIEITENGTYDVIDKALVQVNVPIPQPTGMKEISIMENGTVTEDVSDFASVEIFVTVPTYIQLTQAEYDALTVKDSDTLYVIMEGET